MNVSNGAAGAQSAYSNDGRRYKSAAPETSGSQRVILQTVRSDKMEVRTQRSDTENGPAAGKGANS